MENDSIHTKCETLNKQTITQSIECRGKGIPHAHGYRVRNYVSHGGVHEFNAHAFAKVVT